MELVRLRRELGARGDARSLEEAAALRVRRGRRLRRVELVDNVQAPAVHNLLDQPHERPDELAEQWHARGLVDVSTGELWVSADYESFDDLFQPFTAGTGHSGACYTSLDRAGQNRLRDETHHRVGEPDGAFTLTARAWWARGRVPVR